MKKKCDIKTQKEMHKKRQEEVVSDPVRLKKRKAMHKLREKEFASKDKKKK